MTDFEIAQQLMAEIGPRLELSEVTEFSEDECWVLIVNDETVIAVDYDESAGRLVLSAEVVVPAAESRFQVYEQLLQFNHQWPETGGLRFSLDGPAGTVVQAFDLSLTNLNIQTLESVLANFVEQLAVWRELIQRGATAPMTETTGVPPEPTLTPGMIRA